MTTPNELKTAWRLEDEATRRSDVRAILATPGGRRFLMHLITVSGVYQPFTDLSPHDLARNAGRRDLGLAIISIANHADSAAVLTATRERNALLSSRNTIMEQALHTERTKQ